MPFLETFERKGLFRFTRILALLVIVALILGLIVGAVLFASTLIQSNDKRVEPESVVAAIRPPAPDGREVTSESSTTLGQSGPSLAGSFPGLKIPFSLQAYFGHRDFREFMITKFAGNSLVDQQEYLDNMGEVVDAAKAANLKDSDAIETYVRLKDNQLQVANSRKMERTQMRIYAIEATGATFGLIGLFSLILVLLAIERNTRLRSPEAVDQ